MATKTDKPTRVASDLVEAAAAEGQRHSRSGKQQLDYWARVGRAVTMHQSAQRRRIEAVLAGEAKMATLSTEERTVANAEIDARISAAAHSTSFGEVLAAEGVTTVALDDDGHLVRYFPDGTAEPLEA